MALGCERELQPFGQYRGCREGQLESINCVRRVLGSGVVIFISHYQPLALKNLVIHIEIRWEIGCTQLAASALKWVLQFFPPS